MSVALKKEFPFRLLVGNQDLTFLLDNDFSFSSVDPGGFEAASFSVPRDLPQTLRGTHVRLDCGLAVAFEGRVKEVQRSLGNKTAIQCEGYSALLSDNDGSMIFVDRDLTQWQSPSTARQIALVGANEQIGTSQVAADPTSGFPSLAQMITDSWVSPYMPICEGWYDAGPENLIGAIYYGVSEAGGVGGGSWHVELYASSDANASTVVGTGELAGSLPTAALWTPASQYRFGLTQFRYTATPAGTQGAQYSTFWDNLAVYGNHGLTQRGSAPAGFYPSDIAGWVIGQVAGLQPGVIQETDAAGYIVPHAVYYTPVGFDQMISDMAQQAGWHWGVWESPTPLTGPGTPRFDFRPRPALRTFTGFCLRRDCTNCDIREDVSNQYNVCTVTFANVDGTNGAVTVSLDNPILDQAGISSRTLTLNGGTMTSATAELFGLMALAYTYSEARIAGSIQIDQAIRGPSGPMAPWMLKPGIDRLRVGDLPSFDAFGFYNDVPLTRMEFSGSSSGFSTQLEVGIGASLVETLQARLSAAAALSGIGA